jgi:hypothetical protein
MRHYRTETMTRDSRTCALMTQKLGTSQTDEALREMRQMIRVGNAYKRAGEPTCSYDPALILRWHNAFVDALRGGGDQ